MTDPGSTVAVAVVIVADHLPLVLVDAELGAPGPIARAVLAATSAKAHSNGVWCTPELLDGRRVSARWALRGERRVVIVVTPGRESWHLVELGPLPVDLRPKVRT